MMIPYIALFLIVTAFFTGNIVSIFKGFWLIQISPSTLLTDYITVGGLGATLLNAGLLMLMSYVFVRLSNLSISGPTFAGILTITGFAFFGKNLINVSIIYLGVYLYSMYKHIPIKSVIVILLFSTGVAPISSLLIFGLHIPYIFSIPLGIFVGVFTGFILVEVSTHVITFHRGYNLYNVGFAGGILAILYASIINQFGLTYTAPSTYSDSHHLFLVSLTLIFSLTFLITGFILNNKHIKNYNKILTRSGRAITDFTRKDNVPITMFNIGLTGLVVTGFVLLLGVKFSGPVTGALLTVIGFSAFGKHVKNVLPSMLGVLFFSVVLSYEITSMVIVLTLIFSTGLAPLSGEHGPIVGFISGILHLVIQLGFAGLHSGILLYSNGFTAAFTAVIVHSVIKAFERSY